jgi:hypothetical protein
MKNPRRMLLLLLLVGLTSGAAILSAQRGRMNLGALFDKEDPDTEFAIARWYSSHWRGDGWSHDYPTAEEHILKIIKGVSLIDADEHVSYKVVDLASDEIFKYPFSYVSHPGEVFPSDEEINNLREYIERGGFLILDDFGGQGQGPAEMENFKDMLERAFPGREIYPLRDDHEILRISFQVDSLNMVHPMSLAQSYFYGFDDSHGRLAMVVCYANDIGDYWEFIDQPLYPVKPSAEALKLGVNIALYSMTH